MANPTFLDLVANFYSTSKKSSQHLPTLLPVFPFFVANSNRIEIREANLLIVSNLTFHFSIFNFQFSILACLIFPFAAPTTSVS